jgi:hypothetical protein
VGVDLLDAFTHSGPFRLVGMTAYDLTRSGGVAQAALFDTFGRKRQLEVAIDGLAARFGGKVVQRGQDVAASGGMALTPNLDFLDDGLTEGEV